MAFLVILIISACWLIVKMMLTNPKFFFVTIVVVAIVGVAMIVNSVIDESGVLFFIGIMHLVVAYFNLRMILSE